MSDLHTNTIGDAPNAVTFGVFPGQEIMQPTIVEGSSFMAWKDEAFELWRQWSSLYEDGTKSHNLVQHITDKWFLVNVVDNNYRKGESIFELLTRTKVEMDSNKTVENR
jgi:methylenetetrahydrofolate reductase (NADPH)